VLKSTSKLATEGITVDGTGNDFGKLALSAHFAIVTTDHDLTIDGGSITKVGNNGGTAAFTSLHGDIRQTAAFTTWRLEASAPEGAINFGLGNLGVTYLGDIDALRNILIVRGGVRNLLLDGDIVSAAGDIILVADYGTSKANFHNLSSSNSLTSLHFLIYAYDQSQSIGFFNGIAAPSLVNHRYPELFSGNNLIFARA